MTELNTALPEALQRVLNSGNFILSQEVKAFEQEWASYCGVIGAVGVNNGTDAIKIALQAAGVIKNKYSDEVITSPLTAPYTALAILNAGAIPVFADINPKTYTLDPNSVEKFITPRTRAIVPVHLYGQMSDMQAIVDIAEKHRLVIIEDAAQAHGAKFGGKSAGHFGLAAAFSFYPSKNLGAFGDGGAVITNFPEVFDKAVLLRQGGLSDSMQTDFVGHNSRLDEIQAAVLRVKLKKLEEWTEKRQSLAKIYQTNLSRTSLRLPTATAPESHVFHLFVIQHKQRQQLSDFLYNCGIETLIHYPNLLHQQKLFYRSAQKPLPNAESVVNNLLSLPLYPQLLPEEQMSVIEAVHDFERLFCF